MSRLMTVAVFALLFVAAGTCRAVDSDVTLVQLIKTPNGGGNYTITINGTVTLGTNDTFGGLSAYVTDPAAANTNMIVQNIPPGQGQTRTYSASCGVVQAAGTWKVTVEYNYTSGGQNKTIKISTNFTVP